MEIKQVGVVIIDDSARWVERFEAAVHELGGLTVVGSAGSSGDAIELVSRLRPPILILDMSLNNGSGIDVLNALSDKGIATQVVVVTGFPSDELKATCFELGARYFFDKAFEFGHLQDALQCLASEAGHK